MDYEERQKEIDLMHYWHMVYRKKWLILTITGLVLLLAAIATFTATPVYRATTQILIEEQSSRALSVEDEFGLTRNVTDLRFFNTQLSLLMSRSLAERVAQKMNLLERPELVAGAKKKNIITVVNNIISLNWLSAKKSPNGEDVEGGIRINPYLGVSMMIVSGLQIQPVENTKLVNVSYSSSHPNLAAEIVNTLAQEYMSFSVEKRSGLTQQRLDFLNEQIAILRDELNEKNRELQRYSLEKDIVELSQSENPAVRSYEELHDVYNQAKFDRIRAYTTYSTLLDLQGLSVDELPHLANSPVLDQLQTDYSRLRSDMESSSRKYGSNHPEIKSLENRMSNLATEIQNELIKAIDSADRAYKQAFSQENRLTGELDKQMANVAQSGSVGVQYSLLRIETDSIISQIDFFIKQRDEASVSVNMEGVNIGNISVIDPAEVPMRPVSPNKKRNLFMALIFGLFSGVGVCFVLDLLDNTVKNPEDLDGTGVATLGMVPYLPPEGLGKRRGDYLSKYSDYYSYGDAAQHTDGELAKIKNIELINHEFPSLFISEEFRTIRTSLLLSNADKPPKSLLVTSSLPGEGKTATLSNLAVAFSQLGEKVLIVDADLRKPRLHKVFNVRNAEGLSTYLAGNGDLQDIIKLSKLPSIWILPSGPIPPNPAELFNSDKMKGILKKVENDFDLILFDTPPVLVAVDTIVISPLVDGVVLVIRAQKTVKNAFANTCGRMRQAKANVIGAVINEARMDQGRIYQKDMYTGGA